jgi:hypothetical protein
MNWYHPRMKNSHLVAVLTNGIFMNYEIHAMSTDEKLSKRIKRLKLKTIELFEGGFSFERNEK